MRKIQTLLIFFLIMFYCGISYLVRHPDVSPAYRSYYITQDSGLTLRERKALQPIQSGIQISYADSRIGYDGWHDREPGYRWSAGRSSRIVFLLPPQTDVHGMRTLTLKGTPLDEQKLAVFINGNPVYSGLFPAKGQLDISFPASILLDGENVMRLDCPDAHGTESDRRKRAIALSSFSFS